MLSGHPILGRILGHFPVGAASRNRLTYLSWGFLVTWLNHRSWDLSVRKSSPTFRALRISQQRSLSQSVTPATFRKNPISTAYTWDSTHSVVTNLKLGSEQRPIQKLTILQCLNASVLWPQNDNAAFASTMRAPNSLFCLPPFVNTTITTYLNYFSTCCSVQYYCLLSTDTDVGFWRDIITGLF